ncbi:MAG TPA: FHA domain-containing protein, partial [Phycisphaeraceae bacterium]
MLILIVASGPDKGRIYELMDDQAVVVGREGDPVKLNDSNASRQHARLWSEGGRWYVEDLGSRHGTFRNQKRVERKTVLKDGDRLQVGNTLLVLARMPVEQAERAALLGDAPSLRQARASLSPTRPRWRAPVLTAAALAAGAIVVGVNLFTYFDAAQQRQQLRQWVAQQSTSPGAASAADAGQPSELEPMLQEILAAVQSAPDAELLQQIHEALVDQPQRARPVLDALVAQAQAQREQTRLLEELRQRIESRLSQSEQALAQARDAILIRLQAQPDAQQLLEPLQGLLARSDAATQQKLDQLQTYLDDQNRWQQTFAQRWQALADQVAQMPSVLDKALAQAQGQPVDASSVAQLRQLLQDQRDELTQRLDGLAAQIKSADPSDRVLAAIEELQAALPADAAAAMEQVLARLKGQPSAQQIAEAVRQEVQSASAAYEAMLQKLEHLEDRLAQLPAAGPTDSAGADQRLAQQQAQTTQLLEAILQQLTDPEPMEQLRAEIHQLAQAGQPDLEPLLEQIRQAAQERQAIDDQLARIHDLLQETMPQQQDRLWLEHAMAAAPRSGRAAPSSPAAGGDAAAASEEGASPPASVLPLEMALVPAAPLAGGDAAVPLSPQAPAEAAGDAQLPVLTETERAYKLAFETGKPVTIGAGRVDPETGQPLPGRVLDPAAAKAAGITSWRQWYLMDDFAERMRLQRQAARLASDSRRSVGLITIPTGQPITPPSDAAAQ